MTDKDKETKLKIILVGLQQEECFADPPTTNKCAGDCIKCAVKEINKLGYRPTNYTLKHTVISDGKLQDILSENGCLMSDNYIRKVQKITAQAQVQQDNKEHGAKL